MIWARAATSLTGFVAPLSPKYAFRAAFGKLLSQSAEIQIYRQDPFTAHPHLDNH